MKIQTMALISLPISIGVLVVSLFQSSILNIFLSIMIIIALAGGLLMDYLNKRKNRAV